MKSFLAVFFSVWSRLKTSFFVNGETNEGYEHVFKTYVQGILNLISIYLIVWLCFYPFFKVTLFVGLVFNMYVFICVRMVPSDVVKRMTHVYLITLTLYLFVLVVLTLMFWPSCILMLYFLCIPLLISAIYPWKTVLIWIIVDFLAMIFSFVTFYVLKAVHPALIDQGIPFLSPGTMIFYDLMVTVSCFILIAYAMYYHVLFNKINILESVQTNGTDDDDYAKYENIYRQIVEYFEQYEYYLNVEFSSAQMAHDLKINITYLSKAIHHCCGMNFNTFINSYRINKVKEMLQADAQQFTLQHIFISCGFKSQSVFNKAFKLQVGITPSEYLKTLKHTAISG